jgi:predicted metal-dependent hydrolase
LLEEFEHRSVCFDVFHAVHGGYFLRIYGFIAQILHFKKMITRVAGYLLEYDRQAMTEAERADSIAREKTAAETLNKLMSPRLIKVLLPSYNPRDLEEPKNYRSFLDKFDQAAAA